MEEYSTHERYGDQGRLKALVSMLSYTQAILRSSKMPTMPKLLRNLTRSYHHLRQTRPHPPKTKLRLRHRNLSPSPSLRRSKIMTLLPLMTITTAPKRTKGSRRSTLRKPPSSLNDQKLMIVMTRTRKRDRRRKVFRKSNVGMQPHSPRPFQNLELSTTLSTLLLFCFAYISPAYLPA